MDAIGVYVFKDNPLESITLEELERIYGAAPRSGARVGAWGELGAGGAGGSLRVVTFGFEPGRGAYDVMRELVLGGGKFRPGIIAEPVSTSLVQAVAMEQGAVGYASVYFRTAAAPATLDFISFAQSDEGRQAVKSVGGIPPNR